MTPVWQAPRAGLLWLLISQGAIAAGLMAVLPLWVIALLVVSIGWRLQVYRGAWSYPGRWVKLLLVAVCVSGLLFSFNRVNGLEPLTALLISAVAFKLLEMQRRRDGLILAFVCYFAASLQLLFEQTIAVAAYTLLCLVLVTAALTAMHQGGKAGVWSPLRRGMALIIQSVPLMLILFLVMPRLAAFWAVPGHGATTGISGEMSPGDFSRLGKNGNVVFRASFEGETPEPEQLYWRGPVLTHFSGRRWRQADPASYGDGAHVYRQGNPATAWQQRIDYLGNPWNYTIVMEPTQRPWLFALMAPRVRSDGVGLTRELRLVNAEPVSRRLQYSVTSWPQYRFFPQRLSRWQRRQVLALPKGINPQATSLAQRWRTASTSEWEYINRVLDWYNREFTYTLEPGLLGRHSVDEFLWQSQRGFCEHFAGSFVFLMRAAGIPARVVTGYQGAERHPQEGYLLVHQYNAHAWAEVWLKNRGWVRVDPTAAVAPERIEQGFEAFFGGGQGFLDDSPFSLARFRHIDWLNRLRLKMDSLEYYWGRWVLGYNDRQQSLLMQLLGGVSWTHIGLFMLGSGGLILLLMALWLLRSSFAARERDAVDRCFERFCRKMSKAGWPRKIGEGPRSYLRRLERGGFENIQVVGQILQQYEQLRYAGNEQQLADFWRQVRKL